MNIRNYTPKSPEGDFGLRTKSENRAYVKSPSGDLGVFQFYKSINIT